jgi:hypothetical protein
VLVAGGKRLTQSVIAALPTELASVAIADLRQLSDLRGRRGQPP